MVLYNDDIWRQALMDEVGPAAADGVPLAQALYMELLTCSTDRLIEIAEELDFSLGI